MDTAKHAAQDLWELISGHPTNLRPRPTVHRQPAAYNTYAHKEPEDPTVVAAHAKKERAYIAHGQARAAELQAAKYGDDKELKKAKVVRRRREAELDEAKEEELEAILAVNKAKRNAREAEKAKVGGGREEGKKIKFQKQKAPSGKVPKGASIVAASSGPVPPDGSESQNTVAVKVSKKGSVNPDQTIVPLASEYNRQLGDNERSYLEGMVENPGSAGMQTPSAAARASRVPPASKPPGGSQTKTIIPPDATIPQERTEFNRPLGDMNRTQLDGMQSPSVVAGWHQANSTSSTGRPASTRLPASIPPTSRPPSSRPPSASATKTVTPSTPIPKDSTTMNRPMGDMNRTYIDGMQLASEVARWNGENVRQSSSRPLASRQPPLSRPPTSRQSPASMPLASKSPPSRRPASIPPQTAFQNPTILQDKTEMGRQLGNNERTYVEGVQTPSEIARWNQTNAGKSSSRRPSRPPTKIPPSSRRPASIQPQTTFHNPSIPQIATEMGRQIGNNDRTFVQGMAPNTAYQQSHAENHDASILPDAKSEYQRPLGNMERTIVEGLVPVSQYKKLEKAEKNKKNK